MSLCLVARNFDNRFGLFGYFDFFNLDATQDKNEEEHTANDTHRGGVPLVCERQQAGLIFVCNQRLQTDVLCGHAEHT